MTNKHSTKKAVMTSVLSLVLCFSTLVGMTFAWFTDSVKSESNIIQAPAKDILTISDNLQQNEPDSIAVSVILLMSGKLLNSEETLNYLEKNNILLYRMDSADADDVPLFSDFLQEFFQGG